MEKNSEGRKIIHEGVLDIDGIEIPCYVLEDGSRVISGRGFQEAVKIRDKPEEGEKRGGYILPTFLDSKALRPFLEKKLGMAKPEPLICYRGKKQIHGYEATILTDVCDAILESRREGTKLTERQTIVADQCELLMRSFAKVGIIALVDEATGYQYERERFELQKVLSAYINDELLPWQKKFPDEYYKQIFRLNGWGHFMSGNIDIRNRPGVIGTWTKNLIYKQLPKGVLEELKRKTPKSKSGNYTARFHQNLTPDVGNIHLQQQLSSVITIMRLSKNWKEFEKNFNQLYGQTTMDFPESDLNPEPNGFDAKLKKALDYNPKLKD